jgi:hypothetical protein
MDSNFYVQEQEGDSLLTLLSSLSVESPAENRLKERVGWRTYVSSVWLIAPTGDIRVCGQFFPSQAQYFMRKILDFREKKVTSATYVLVSFLNLFDISPLIL